MVGIYLLGKRLQKIEEKYVVAIMVAIEAIIALLMITTYDTKPCSDYAAIWKTACQYARGDYSAGLKPDNYMYYFNWQIGIAFFESLIIRVFGENFLVLKILNAMLVIGFDYCMYRLIKRESNREIACFGYALATLHIATFMTIPQLTNHHVTIFMAFLIYRLIESDKLWKWAVAGIVTAIMNVIRPYGILFLLTATCLVIYKISKGDDSKQRELMRDGKRSVWLTKPLWRGIVSLLLMLTTYHMQMDIVNKFFLKIGATDSNITDPHMPYYKFEIGMIDGSWGFLSELEEVDFNYDEYNQIVKEQIVETFKHRPLSIVKYVANKMCRYLGMFDYQFENTYDHNMGFWTRQPVRAFYCTSWFQYAIILLLSFLGYWKHKLYKVDAYSIFFIGNTIVYLFIEAFSSYRFESYVFLLYLAAHGMYAVQKRRLA